MHTGAGVQEAPRCPRFIKLKKSVHRLLIFIKVISDVHFLLNVGVHVHKASFCGPGEHVTLSSKVHLLLMSRPQLSSFIKSGHSRPRGQTEITLIHHVKEQRENKNGDVHSHRAAQHSTEEHVKDGIIKAT